MSEPLVSVVIPTYGRGTDVICRSVQSVRRQDYPRVEIVVADDNPQDSPLRADIAAYCKELGIVCVTTQGHQGACVARNVGAAAAKGTYYGFLDDDDEWDERKISLSLPLFTEGVGMVCSRGWRVIENETPPRREDYAGDMWRPSYDFDFLLCLDAIGTTTQAILSKACFDAVGGFRPDMPARQDYEMWLRVAKQATIRSVDAYLFTHYIYSKQQISASHERALKGLQLIYEEFESEYKKNARARAYIWQLMLMRYSALNDSAGVRRALRHILFAKPRAVGRYLVKTTNSPFLRKLLHGMMRNEPGM